MKIDHNLLDQVRQEYALNRKISVPYLQRKWKIGAELAKEIAKYLKVK